MEPTEYLDWSEPVLGIIGPSGSGKSSVVHILLERGLIDITPTWTTRPARSDEAEIEHRFVSEPEFEELMCQGFFLDPVQLFGLPYWYGLPRIPRPAAGKIPAVMIRVMVKDKMDEFYPNNLIYQIEDRFEEIERRLREREVRGESTGTRISQFTEELAAGRLAADRVFQNHGSLEELADRVEKALRKDFGLPG